MNKIHLLQIFRNPKGFTQVMRACQLLKERNVPFRLTCSVTPENVNQLKDLFKIANELNVPFSQRPTCSQHQEGKKC